MPEIHDSNVSRRQMLAGVGAVGVAGTGLLSERGTRQKNVIAASARQSAASDDGTPEQIHLEWGDDPATMVTVSWASPGRAVHPRLLLAWGDARRVVPAVERCYTDGLNGETVYTYHAAIMGLRPATSYSYTVAADNDRSAQPFSASFTTAPVGRAAFRFTSFGDLATPNTQWVLSYGQAAYAVAAVESFKPLFHLVNGDLCYADLNPMHQPEVWRDFGNNNQASAASRPWMPCPGNHEIEFYNGPQGFGSYLTRYSLPDNGVPGFRGHWYKFRVGSVLFISLDADDVAYQDSGPAVSGPAPLAPDPSTGNAPIAPGTSYYVRDYSRGAQTAWLRQTLVAARASGETDWIVAQMHQCPATSALKGNGCDLGIRQEWVPLFDEFQVDLVVCGHDHNYERSFPVRGYDPMAGTDIATGTPVETRRPHPVTTTDNGVFDTSTGTVYMVLGTGGTNAVSDQYDIDPADGLPRAHVFTRPNRPVPASPGTYTRAVADAHEDAVWSAKLDETTGYGVTVFDVDPGTEAGGQTSITVAYYHAAGADPVNAITGVHGAPQPNYTKSDTFKLIRPRSDNRSRQASATTAARA